MTDPSPLPWQQPPGLWRARGAHLAALQLGQSRPVSAWPEPTWHDQTGLTLWHYWAAGPTPLTEWEALCSSNQGPMRDALTPQGLHPWHLLALRGQSEAMVQWLERFGLPALGTWRGESWLQGAIWSGDEATLALALKHDRPALALNDSGSFPPLVVALYRGGVNRVRQLLRAGADADAVDPTGRSALHHAALLGDFALLGELEDAGGDADREDRDGRTPQALFDQRGGKGSEALRAHWAHKYADKLAF